MKTDETHVKVYRVALSEWEERRLKFSFGVWKNLQKEYMLRELLAGINLETPQHIILAERDWIELECEWPIHKYEITMTSIDKVETK